MFKKSHIYFRIQKGEVHVSQVESGNSAKKFCTALSHPRTLMGDFFAIESCFKEAFTEVMPKSWLSLSPIAIVQLLETYDGGYTNVEIKAFREAVLGAGARQVFFADSNDVLSPSDIQNRNFNELKSA
ncbi:hypothetical protein [Enterovibrio coralii]|uniref:Rod shape-determining protein MreB n=1 Tax=Enterovibrio coralii TaxID=294935 RepID=A0A135I927_9GAMM|nr:hypothetical protein [Enterovibrio coralii]KXF81918.1 hypothetical protein ATN88_18295 [Enterovibrio coralii]